MSGDRTKGMNAGVFLYQNGFFRFLDVLRGRDNVRRLKFLRKSQFWSAKDLREWQLQRLNRLLATALADSPYYSQKLRDLKLPLESLDAIRDLPVLTRRDLQGNFENIRCSNVSKKLCELSRTGGSTGEPANYYLSKGAKDWNRGSVYRSAEWADVYLGERTVQLTGSHYDMKEFQKIKNRVVLFLQRYRYYSVAYLTEELLDRYYHSFMRYKPTSLWGFASAVYLLADFVSKHYPASDFSFLKALITSSETLQPLQRQKMEEVFGAGKVFDHYGSREVYIASECSQHRGYHIHAEVILLEVVDKNNHPVRDGELGRILITDLSNLAFPFIRYEIGDVGTLSSERSCGCGVTLPMLESVEGRLTDVLVLGDRIVSGLNFNNLMSDLNGIEAYQVVQNSVDELRLRIVKNPAFGAHEEATVRETLSGLAGERVNTILEYVDEIPVPESGKRRYVISNVSRDFM
jgi:phenylacetate-CoA ligase